jgi:hypothetical protein
MLEIRAKRTPPRTDLYDDFKYFFFNLGEKIKKLGDELYQKGPKNDSKT